MASITCGNCKQTHQSVDQVRDCHSRQRNDLRNITSPGAWKQPEVRVGGRAFGRIYDEMRRVGGHVPAGRYALSIAGSISFYKVDKPTEGKWAGSVFVRVQASDDTYPLRGQSALEVLIQIALNPQEAMLRYGREIGQCGHCGRTLTNEESRAAGIGPICREKVGFAA